MQQQMVVTYTISQTEIRTSLDIGVKKHHLKKLCVYTQKIVCTHKKIRFSLYFHKNITSLSAGLLIICQAFFLSPLKLCPGGLRQIALSWAIHTYIHSNSRPHNLQLRTTRTRQEKTESSNT